MSDAPDGWRDYELHAAIGGEAALSAFSTSDWAGLRLGGLRLMGLWGLDGPSEFDGLKLTRREAARAAEASREGSITIIGKERGAAEAHALCWRGGEEVARLEGPAEVILEAALAHLDAPMDAAGSRVAASGLRMHARTDSWGKWTLCLAPVPPERLTRFIALAASLEGGGPDPYLSFQDLDHRNAPKPLALKRWRAEMTRAEAAAARDLPRLCAFLGTIEDARPIHAHLHAALTRDLERLDALAASRLAQPIQRRDFGGGDPRHWSSPLLSERRRCARDLEVLALSLIVGPPGGSASLGAAPWSVPLADPGAFRLWQAEATGAADLLPHPGAARLIHVDLTPRVALEAHAGLATHDLSRHTVSIARLSALLEAQEGRRAVDDAAHWASLEEGWRAQWRALRARLAEAARAGEALVAWSDYSGYD